MPNRHTARTNRRAACTNRRAACTNRRAACTNRRAGAHESTRLFPHTLQTILTYRVGRGACPEEIPRACSSAWIAT